MTQTLLKTAETVSHGAPSRVLLLSHSPRLHGGAQRQLLDLAGGLRALGMVPIVGVPREGTLTQALRRLGIETVRSPDHRLCGRGLDFFRRYVRARLVARDFAREIASLGVDVVHSNMSGVGYGAFAAHRVGLPHVWHFHERKREWLLPGSTKERFVLRQAVATTKSQVVVPSHEFASLVRGYVPEGLLCVVPNGVLQTRDRRPLRVRPRSGELRILVVGRAKGWETAVDCLAALNEAGVPARLTFVGESRPPKIKAVSDRAEALGMGDRLLFVPPVDDLQSYYANADVLLHPSPYETFGRVLVEAMAVGLPVVAHRTGGIPEIVEDGKTGVLTPVGDAKAMAVAVARLATDGVKADRIRSAAYDDVWERFTIEPFAAAFAEIYRGCPV